MQASRGAANPMLPAEMTGVQFMDHGRVAPAIAGAAAVAPPAFSGDKADSDGGSGSGGEADQNDGMRTPGRGENAERAPAPAAEAPLRRARVSVRARSEAPMVCKNADTDLYMLLLSANSKNIIHMSGFKSTKSTNIFMLVSLLKFLTNLVWGYVHICV